MKIRKILVVLSVFVIIICLAVYITEKRNRNALSAMTSLNRQNAVIVIDAGHGGFDGGASSADGTVEKGINLSIALKLDEIMRFSGFSTVMTRTEDTLIYDSSARSPRQQKISDIHNRVELVEKTDNSILVSIHQNHFSASKYSGAQVFYSKNNPLSNVLADSIQKSIVECIQPQNKRAIKPSGTEIYLLYNVHRPAVMVECGFLSNYEEAGKLKDPVYQMQMALSIMMGIMNFLNVPEDV
jgi:N-acetylmuramoyl-L-alanine amidase